MAESQFPVQVDELKKLQDFPQSEATNISRYNELRMKSTLTSTEQTELANLRSILNNYLLTAEDFNLMANAIEATQQFTKDNVDGYFQIKQNEFNQILNKFNYKNLYDNATTYQQWNIVTYNNETYMSKHDNNLGNTPIGDTSDTHWAKIAARGKQGIPGIGLVFTGEYNNSVTYQPQHAVRYEGDIYYCIATSTGNLPTDTTYWTLFLSAKSVVISNIEPSNPEANPVWIDTSV